MRSTFSLIIISVIIAGCVYIGMVKLTAPAKALSSEIEKALEESRPEPSQEETELLSFIGKSIVSGGPPKDGIPSIDSPHYTSPEEADSWFLLNDVVFGVDYQGFVAAYPQRILVWHEIVNKRINEEQVSITYCPLTGTVIGYMGQIAPDVEATFGVSGRLVNSNLVMCGRVSESFWHQILGRAINGPSWGVSLEEFPIVWTTWEKWNEPFAKEAIDSQLDDQTLRLLASADKFRIARGEGRVYLSSIFKWFGDDFVKSYSTYAKFAGYSDAERAVLNFISGYVDEDDAEYLAEGKFSIEYLDYDWSLNDKKGG